MKRCIKYKGLLLLLLPSFVWFFIFKYVPMYGVIVAFKDYKPMLGIMESDWAGFKYFERLFTNSQFFTLLKNTLIISTYKLIFVFPAPILLALLLNEVRHERFKKAIQTVTYLPHFISWVVIGGLIQTVLSPTNGVVNYVLGLMGVEPIKFMMIPELFRGIVIAADIWKEAGWGSIVYLAAISGIDQDMYEAAEIDGAGRLRQAVSITLPALAPVIVMMFILRIGNMMDAGFDGIVNLYNPTVYGVADIFDTYAYRVGLIDFNFSYSTAISLFKNVVGLLLLIFASKITKRISGYGIW
ncbi:ABC transporter permease [Paenibacillus hamazuiensis]|uniref:ABC transporter permease n=1 Tax=Paenibacillus hamazuiensis TaxID=2936508 RepID=UPI002010577D|nr:ABC transporter permease subunit [Paenibacillus hamazuiensis]